MFQIEDEDMEMRLKFYTGIGSIRYEMQMPELIGLSYV